MSPIEQGFSPPGPPPLPEEIMAQLASIQLRIQSDDLTLTQALTKAYWIGTNGDRGYACTWTEDPDGPWDTACGHCFLINEGTPIENDMIYCPYCAGVIEERECQGEDTD